MRFTLRETDLQTFLAPGSVPREADLSVHTVALKCSFCIGICLHGVSLREMGFICSPITCSLLWGYFV